MEHQIDLGAQNNLPIGKNPINQNLQGLKTKNKLLACCCDNFSDFNS